MSIVRHSNPFPDIRAAFITWNAERKRIASLPIEERRAHKAAQKAATRQKREAFKKQHYPKGWYWRAVNENRRMIQDRVVGNLWGMLHHGTWIRVGLCFGVLHLLATPHVTGLFAVGLLLHVLFHTELADDNLIETRLARGERKIMALTAVIAVMILVGTAPLARGIVIEMLLPVASGALAPISYARPVTAASGSTASGKWLKDICVTILDATLLVALLLGIHGARDEEFAAGIRNTNWHLCEPLAWHMGSLDTPALLAALDRNGNLGPCFVDDKSLTGITPLHMAVGLGDNRHHIRTLAERGADINALRRGAVTPLHDAAARKTDPGPFMTMLLDLGADPTIRNVDGDTASDIAARNSAVPQPVAERLRDAEAAWRARADAGWNPMAGCSSVSLGRANPAPVPGEPEAKP